MQGVRKTILVDLDGTLCDISHRQHLAEAGEWEEFHSRCEEDGIHEEVAVVLRSLDHVGHPIVAVTGRGERWRIITERWLRDHGIPADTVLMRTNGDRRPDGEVKLEAVRRWAMGEGLSFESDILVGLEDSARAVDTWREAGIKCWQVRA